MLVLLGGFALVISDYQRDARHALTDRFAARTKLIGSFARSYVDDVAGRERRIAGRLLSGDHVDQATFERVAQDFNFNAAVLLDRNGRLLEVWPRKPSMLGTDMTVKYPHLHTAVVEGKIGVSPLVPSAARGLPITAVAVPYETASGRRVISGAFSPADSPLNEYFASAVSVSGGNAVLIDKNDHVLASAHPNQKATVRQTAHNGVEEVVVNGTKLTMAVAQVPGTPWRVVLTTPSAKFYAPVTNGRWTPWALWMAFAGAGVVAMILFLRLGRAHAAAAETARTDVLTGLPNRRAMEETLARAVSYSTRHGLPLTALMVDLDHFKAINDSRGHQGGDAALQQVATHVRDAVRKEDVAGRWGGEEFLVLLPHTGVRGGLEAAERIRIAIEGTSEQSSDRVTASIGLAVLGEGADALLRDADEALYEAKEAGRNCTIAAPSCFDPPSVELVAGDRTRPSRHLVRTRRVH